MSEPEPEPEPEQQPEQHQQQQEPEQEPEPERPELSKKELKKAERERKKLLAQEEKERKKRVAEEKKVAKKKGKKGQPEPEPEPEPEPAAPQPTPTLIPAPEPERRSAELDPAAPAWIALSMGMPPPSTPDTGSTAHLRKRPEPEPEPELRPEAEPPLDAAPVPPPIEGPQPLPRVAFTPAARLPPVVRKIAPIEIRVRYPRPRVSLADDGFVFDVTASRLLRDSDAANISLADWCAKGAERSRKPRLAASREPAAVVAHAAVASPADAPPVEPTPESPRAETDGEKSPGSAEDGQGEEKVRCHTCNHSCVRSARLVTCDAATVVQNPSLGCICCEIWESWKRCWRPRYRRPSRSPRFGSSFGAWRYLHSSRRRRQETSHKRTRYRDRTLRCASLGSSKIC
eukprot:COSAG04_NODE_2760_length_3626_cov_8.144430_2_plen_401_part_00